MSPWVCRLVACWLAMAVWLVAPAAMAAPAQLPETFAEAESLQQPLPPTAPLDAAAVVDRTTLDGKLMAGYQGWFAAEGDGSGRGWRHFGGERLGPGRCTFDLWPELRELGPDEQYPSPFRNSAGEPQPLFSSFHPQTVDRHFAWMRDYGLDGVFLQRFLADLRAPRDLHFRNVVTRNVQLAANRHGRTWAMMYDLSGSSHATIYDELTRDWARLVDRQRVLDDPAYLHHNGRPVVAVWGVGFGDGRNYTIDDCDRIVEFLKHDSRYGGMCVMLGVPGRWLASPESPGEAARIREVVAKADIVSPWSVGRYHNLTAADEFVTTHAATELQHCRSAGQDYLPVIFPGFSWHNLQMANGQPQRAKLNEIPRLGGEFLWRQAVANRRAGANMLYLAMFDEIDEGTAILKVSNTPPVGASPFLTYEGLPDDHYLWLSGQVARMLRGEIPDDRFPQRN